MPDTAALGVADTTSFFSTDLEARDPEVFAAIEAEQSRQQHQIELIASENIVSQAVLDAQGLDPDKQICRRLSGAAVLWWLRVCGHC